MDDSWMKDILNTRLTIPGIEHAFEVPNYALCKELRKIVDRAPTEIFVLCSDKLRCGYLMDQFAREMFSSITKVNKDRYTVQIGTDIYRFVTEDELRMIVKGRRATKVVYETQFERAIDLYKQMKEGYACEKCAHHEDCICVVCEDGDTVVCCLKHKHVHRYDACENFVKEKNK